MHSARPFKGVQIGGVGNDRSRDPPIDRDKAFRKMNQMPSVRLVTFAPIVHPQRPGTDRRPSYALIAKVFTRALPVRAAPDRCLTMTAFFRERHAFPHHDHVSHRMDEPRTRLHCYGVLVYHTEAQRAESGWSTSRPSRQVALLDNRLVLHGRTFQL